MMQQLSNSSLQQPEQERVARANYRGCDWVLRDRGDDLLLTMVRKGAEDGKPQLVQLVLDRAKLDEEHLIGETLKDTLQRVHDKHVHRFASGITTKGKVSEVVEGSLPSLGEYRASLRVSHSLGEAGLALVHGRAAAAAQEAAAPAPAVTPVKVAEISAPVVELEILPSLPQTAAPVRSPEVIIDIPASVVPAVAGAGLTPIEHVVEAVRGAGRWFSGTPFMARAAAVVAAAGVMCAAYGKDISNAIFGRAPAPEPVPAGQQVAAPSAAPQDIYVAPAASSAQAPVQIAALGVSSEASSPAAPRAAASDTRSHSATDGEPVQLASAAAPAGGSSAAAAPSASGGSAAAAPALSSHSNTWTMNVDVEGLVGLNGKSTLTYGGDWDIDLSRNHVFGVDRLSIGLSSAGGLFAQELSIDKTRKLCGCHGITYQRAHGEDVLPLGNGDAGITLGYRLSEHLTGFIEGGGIGRLDYQGLQLEPAGIVGINYHRTSDSNRETDLNLRVGAGPDHFYAAGSLRQDLVWRLGVEANGNITTDHSFNDPNIEAAALLSLNLTKSPRSGRLDVVAGVAFTDGGGNLAGALNAEYPPLPHHSEVVWDRHSESESKLSGVVGLRWKF